MVTAGRFILYATRNYLLRPFNLFELMVVMKLRKPIQVVWEPDTRHYGFREFREFAKRVADDFKGQVLEKEPIKWEKKDPFKSFTVSLLVPRLEGVMPLATWSAKKLGEWVADLGKAFEDY